jgi:hypothetical protein
VYVETKCGRKENAGMLAACAYVNLILSFSAKESLAWMSKEI